MQTQICRCLPEDRKRKRRRPHTGKMMKSKRNVSNQVGCYAVPAIIVVVLVSLSVATVGVERDSTPQLESNESSTVLQESVPLPSRNAFKNESKKGKEFTRTMPTVYPTVNAIYNASRNKIVLNVTWTRPPEMESVKSYDFKVSSNNSSSDCKIQEPYHAIDQHKDTLGVLLPPLINKFEIVPGCSYKIEVITNRYHLGKVTSTVVYTVPDCVGKRCSCRKFTPDFERFKADEVSPGVLNVSWSINILNKNHQVYNITDKLFEYRPSTTRQFHNNPFKRLSVPVKSPKQNYIIIADTRLFVANQSYHLRAIFNNSYNCKAFAYTNFTVTELPSTEKVIGNSLPWIQWVLVVLILSFTILFSIYCFRRNRLVIKEILSNPLSLHLIRRRSIERRESYIMIPTIAKQQQELNLLYVDKEIIDGETDRFEFPRSRIKFVNPIGEGAFGQVYLAKAFGIDGQPGYSHVAVKTLKETASTEEMDDFLSEIDILKKVGEHPNIVKMYGCCILKRPYLMVMEFVPCKDLKLYLLELRNKWTKRRSRTDSSVTFYDSSDGAYIFPDGPIPRVPIEARPSVTETEYTSLDSDGTPSPTDPFVDKVDQTLDHTELQHFALQIARGMEHLEKIPICHRDLAARNVLINEYKMLKISDFGLSRIGPYVNSKRRKVPLRWMAIEAIEDNFYDSKSDVWSFAIVLWEIGTLGAFPYEDVMDSTLVYHILNGKRLQRPEICTDELYSLMLRCWSYNPQSRPSFHELVELLDVKKRRIYVDFSLLNPTYMFPPAEAQEANQDSKCAA